jgi:hypothetical protein
MLTRQILRLPSIGWSPIKSGTQAKSPYGEALICDKHCQPRTADVATTAQIAMREVKVQVSSDVLHDARTSK